MGRPPSRPNNCQLYGYCVPNEYIEPSEIDTFHRIEISKKGIVFHPNGTNPTPLQYNLSGIPLPASYKEMDKQQRLQFLLAIGSILRTKYKSLK